MGIKIATLNTLKRARYFAVAVALALASAPFAGFGVADVSAAPSDYCVTNGSRQTLEQYLTNRNHPEASLCSTINSNSTIRVTRSATLDLNGRTLTLGGLRASQGSTITILATNGGAYNGDLDPGSNGTFVIYGGTFSDDPSEYLADNLEAVRGTDGKWTVREIVEPEYETVEIEKYFAIDEYSNNHLGNDIEVPDATDSVVVTSSNPEVADYNADDIYKIDTLTVGSTVVTYEFLDEDENTLLIVNATIHTYVLNPTDVVIMEGTSISLSDARFGEYDDLSNISVRALWDVEESTFTGTTLADAEFTAGAELNSYSFEAYVGEESLGYLSITVFPKQMTDQVLAADGEALEKTIEIETSNMPTNTEFRFISSDENVVKAVYNGDETFTLTAQGLGEAVVSVLYNSDDFYGEPMEQFKVKVYSFDAEEEVVIPVGAEIDLSDGVISRIGNPSAVSVELDSTDYATLSGETAESTLTASAAGNATLTFKAGETVLGTTSVKVYEVPELEDMFLQTTDSEGNLATSGTLAGLTGTNLPGYTVVTEDTQLIEIAEGTTEAQTVSARQSAGDAVVTVRFNDSLGTTETTFNVVISRFTTDASNRYDIAKGDSVSFSVTEDYDQSWISCTAGNVDCSNSEDFDVSEEEGVFTITASDDIEGGQYTLTFTDANEDGTIGTRNVTIRVHEIVVSGDSERYVAINENNAFANIITVRVSEKSGFSRSRNISYTSTGGPVGGIGVAPVSGTYIITVRQAGSYALTFTDGVASTTVYIYALSLSFDQTTFYVKAGEQAVRFVNAMNEYWHDINVGANPAMIDTEFISSDDENLVAGFVSNTDDGQRYVIAADGVEAGNYQMVFRAYANNNKSEYSEKSITVRVYEMVAPEETTYYAETGDSLNITVTDKNAEYAYTRAVVESGDASGLTFNRRANGNLRNFNVTARRAGVYTVRYTDYMEDGTTVGEYVATIIVVEVEEENNLLVAKGESLELTGHSVWNTTLADNITTGDDLTVDENEDGDFVALFETAELEPGRYSIELSHTFEDGTSMVVKRVGVIVYEFVADSENDPEGVTTATIEAYLESLINDGRIDDLLNVTNGAFGDLVDFFRLLGMSYGEEAQMRFGDSSLASLYGLRDTLNDGLILSTRVVVRPFEEDEEIDEELASYIGSLDIDIESLAFFDVSVVMNNGTEDFGELHELVSEITFVLCEVSEPAEGYEREYIVIRQHNGVSEILSADKYFIKDGKLYVSSSEFSTYAVTFEDTLIPAAPDTGNFTAEGAGVNEPSVMAAIMASVVALIVAVGAVKFAKRH